MAFGKSEYMGHLSQDPLSLYPSLSKQNKTTPRYGSSVLSRCSQEHRAASPNGSQSRTAVSPQEGEVPALFLLSFVLRKLFEAREAERFRIPSKPHSKVRGSISGVAGQENCVPVLETTGT